MKKAEEINILRKALELAAEDYYRGCKLAPDQKDDLIEGVIAEWVIKANRLITGTEDPK